MQDDIYYLEKSAMERWRNGDPMGWVEISAEDILYVDPSLASPIIGLDKFRAQMQQAIGMIHYQGSDFISPKTIKVGDAVLLTYNYRSTELNPEGMVMSQTPWNTTEVYFKRGDEWKIVHTHWSYIKHRVREQVDVPLPVCSTTLEYGGLLGELMMLERKAMERWRKGDPWGYVGLYAPEVTYFDPGTSQRIDGRQALSAVYQQLEGKISYEVMDFIDPVLLTLGDMAVLFYRFLSTRLNQDGSVSKRTPWNCTEVYRCIDGNWRIIHNHWSHIMGERY